MDLKEEDILQDKIADHWYYVSKGRALLDFLGKDIRVKEVLDVGAGSGVFSRQLLDAGVCSSAVCVDPFYKEERLQTHNGRPIHFVKSVESVPQNLILMMDVLEHVDDDVGLLRQFGNPMPESGRILITVPAFQFMWSAHDVFLEHRRRYTIKMLERTVYKAGLEPVKMRYFFGALFPLTAAQRLAKRVLFERGRIKARSELKLFPRWLNQSLIGIHDIERHTLFKINKLAGLSLFCLCKK